MTERQYAERKLSEIHHYVRHTFQILVGWFTFFVTVNYASMGWLAKPSAQSTPSRLLVATVAVMFVTQNILGIMACHIIREYLLERHAETLALERQVASATDIPKVTSSVPASLYSRTIRLMQVALVPILIAWMIFGTVVK